MDWMLEAFKEAERGRNTCMPNPMVGCVVVKDHQIVGRGAHLKTGESHAEVLALREAQERAKGADVYLTLEPCCHYGRTPPCVDLLIAAQVRCVHIAILDPNPKVSGLSVKKLREAGIQVKVSAHEEQAFKLNEIFFHYITQNKPFLIAKWAMTLDGKIATHTGDSQWISSPLARQHAHELRSQVSAVMIGAQTLRRDNPQLTARHLSVLRQPTPILITQSGDLPLQSHILQPESKAIVVMSEAVSPTLVATLLDRGLEVIQLPAERGGFNLDILLEILAQKDISSVLLEGGEKLLTSFYQKELIQRFIVYIAPKILGGRNSLTPLKSKDFNLMKEALELRNPTFANFGPDLCMIADAPKTPPNYKAFLEKLR